jgi:adenylyltransferase/sulfurtransferase
MDLSRQEAFLDTQGILKKENYSKKIVLVGCGGSGTPLAELLVRGGFTHITLIDFDVIEKSNIQRQLFLPKHIGAFKAEKLKKRLLTINSEIQCTSIVDKLSKKNIDTYLDSCEIILDATDNFETRFLIDKYSKTHNTPWIYLGAIKGEVICGLMDGENSKFEQLISKNFKNEGCEVGVLGSTTFVGASITYNILLKYLMDTKYKPTLIKFNIWNGQYFEVEL